MSNAIFYRAGRPVCLGAEHRLLGTFDRAKYRIDPVHPGEQPSRIGEAEAVGIKSVPAILMNSQIFHIDFGAALANLKS